jgi:hypothetical protein
LLFKRDMKTTSHLASLALVLAAACNGAAMTPPQSTGADAAVPGLDPTGNWNVVYSFSPACGNASSTTTGTFTVTYSATGYDVEVAGTMSTGVIVCMTDECKLSGTWAWAGSDAAYEQSMNLVLAADSTVSGEGTESVVSSDGTQCTYPFTATGSRM